MKFNFINVALLSFSVSAFSLGMGDLKINSYLNQPFYGEIKLIDVGNVPLSGIQASVASIPDFERIGLSYDDDLDKLHFKVQKNKQGEPVIVITSTERINEPYLELVVDLAWSNGQLYRAYTLLLDPPKYTIVTEQGQKAATFSYGKYSKQKGVVEKEVYLDKTVLPKQDDVNRPESTYGPTTGKEDIYEIAQRYVTPNTSIQQIILAINGANLGAFKDGNINGILAGKILKIPSNEEVAQIPKDLAVKEIAAQDKAWTNKESIDHVLIPPYTKGIVIAPDSKLHEITLPKQPEASDDNISKPLQSQPEETQPDNAQKTVIEGKVLSPDTADKSDTSKEIKSDKDEKSALLFSLSPDTILPTIAGHPIEPESKQKPSQPDQGTKDNKVNIKQPNQQEVAKQPIQQDVAKKSIQSSESTLDSANSVAALQQQLSMLRDSNQKLQETMAQRDRDIAQLKQQLSLIIKTRQGISGQSSSPLGADNEFPWLWVFIALVALSAGVGGYFYREELQSIYQRRRKEPDVEQPKEDEGNKAKTGKYLTEDIDSTDDSSGDEKASISESVISQDMTTAVHKLKSSETAKSSTSPSDIEQEFSRMQQLDQKTSTKQDVKTYDAGEEVSVRISRKSEEISGETTKNIEKQVDLKELEKLEKELEESAKIKVEESNVKPIEQKPVYTQEDIEPSANKTEIVHEKLISDNEQNIKSKMDEKEPNGLEFEITDINESAPEMLTDTISNASKEDINEDVGLTFEKIDIEKPEEKTVQEETTNETDENALEFDIDTDAIFASSGKGKSGLDSIDYKNEIEEDPEISIDEVFELKTKDESEAKPIEEHEMKVEEEPELKLEEPELKLEEEPELKLEEEPELKLEEEPELKLEEEPELKLEEEPELKLEEEPELKLEEEPELKLEEEPVANSETTETKSKGSKTTTKKTKDKKKSLKKDQKDQTIELSLEDSYIEDASEESKEEDTYEFETEFSLTDLVESATGHVHGSDGSSTKKKLVKSKKAMDTLLSLAETYITMGDKESARQSLEEVLEYGDEEQKAEAKKLLNSM